MLLRRRGSGVPEIGLAAPDAGVTSLNRPVRLVELDLGAVVVGHGAFAAELIQTPAFAGLFRIKGGREFAGFVMGQAFALFVYGFSVEHDRTVHGVHFRNGQVVGQEMNDGSNQVVGVGGQPGMFTALTPRCLSASLMPLASVGFGLAAWTPP